MTRGGDLDRLGVVISIHALREEGDRGAAYALRRHQDFYPRPPRGGRRSGATLSTGQPNFYPRPPRGGRLVLAFFRSSIGRISIHALREEGDSRSWRTAARSWIFLSTPSARRATRTTMSKLLELLISIHALREEGDEDAEGRCYDWYISIHALREEGDAGMTIQIADRAVFLSTPSARRATNSSIHSLPEQVFLSTPSARRATPNWDVIYEALKISIHALREEGDAIQTTLHLLRQDFYPRPPRGGRPENMTPIDKKLIISIHALREEGDVDPHHSHCHWCDFYPRPPRGGRPIISSGADGAAIFLSTPSARRATDSPKQRRLTP